MGITQNLGLNNGFLPMPLYLNLGSMISQKDERLKKYSIFLLKKCKDVNIKLTHR